VVYFVPRFVFIFKRVFFFFSFLIYEIINHLPTTELLNAKLKSRENVQKYTAVITGDLIKHEEKLSKLLNNIG
jgi:hypothetical protein